jgi:tetratricopeptide (TPR) repeat protein
MKTIKNLELELKQNYDRGLQFLEQKDQVSALREFKLNYEMVKTLDFISSDQDLAELIPYLSLSLKKIGWICRQNQEYEKAYYYHQVRFEYLKLQTSHLDLHDACISLDIDSFYLKDLRLCKLWLNTSLQHAKLINNPIDQTKALAMSYNNLSGTYSEMGLFKESLEFIDQSLDHWMKYEAYCGTEENRVVWAYFAVAEVFYKWQTLLQSQNERAQWQRQEALKNYQKCLQIALARNLNSQETEPISLKINQLHQLEESSL